MQIGRKIYYELSTGNVIQDTGERSGSVIETTTADDFAAYASLAERVPSTVGVIQLEYGELAQDFRESNGYHINLATNEIEFSYSDPSNPEAPPVYRLPLSVEIENLKAENATLKAETAILNLQDTEMWETIITLLP